MDKENITQKTTLVLDDQQSQPAHVKYILVKTLCECDGIDRIPVYGIKAELFINSALTDSSFVSDITSSEPKCKALMEMLAKNKVTPVTLKDVIEDLIAEGALPSCENLDDSLFA
jgi:hypothetical protein